MSSDEIIAVDDGATLWTVSSGMGPGLVLCHGGPGMHDYLAPVAQMLDDLYTVHRWDQRGAGRSSHTGPYALARFVADLEALRAHFDHQQWIVAGHSWGATLALHYAIAHPDRTSALIYMSGTGLAWGTWKRAYHDAEEARFTPKERARHKELKDKLRAGSLTDPAAAYEFQILNDLPNFADRKRAWLLARADVEEMLRFPINYEANQLLSAEIEGLDEEDLVARCARLSLPVLVIDGVGDPRPRDAVASLVRVLPRCERVVLPGVGHMPWMEDPGAMQEALRAFLARAHDQPESE